MRPELIQVLSIIINKLILCKIYTHEKELPWNKDTDSYTINNKANYTHIHTHNLI